MMTSNYLGNELCEQVELQAISSLCLLYERLGCLGGVTLMCGPEVVFAILVN